MIHESQKRSWIGRVGLRVALPLACLLAVCGVAISSPPEEAVVVVATHVVDPVPGRLFDSGLAKAIDGEFAQALVDIQAAGKASPESPRIIRATSLLQGHLARIERMRKERETEYAYEVERVKWANLAQDHLPALEKASYVKELRKIVQDELADAYEDIGLSEILEQTDADKAAEMRNTSLTSIRACQAALKKTLAFFDKDDKADKKDKAAKNDKDDKAAAMDVAWVRQFRLHASQLEKDFTAAQKAWESLDPDTAKGRWASAKVIRPIELDVADALTDLEVMVSKRPWRIALLHARLAREITTDRDTLAKAAWFRTLCSEMETRAKKDVAKAKWYDAMSIYLALEDLNPDSKDYREAGKRVRRHVRILHLYGKDEEDEDDDKLAGSEYRSDPPVWKDAVRDVDVQMVRRAISRLGSSYVESVDYRKLTKAALGSIRVLVETPQVLETFPGLKDKAKRKAFLDAIGSEIEQVAKKDRVDSMDLKIALNRLIFSSENTVNIPVEVLVVEFADGFLQELDKFSRMIWPNDVTNFNKSMMGQFLGIGVQITKKKGEPLKVVTPLLGSPAYEAKIKAGDLIMAVDGHKTNKDSIDSLIKRIMGPANTTVELTIKRRGIAEPFKVPVKRQKVEVRTVKGWERGPDHRWDFTLGGHKKIGYIRLTQFTGTSAKNLHDALLELKAAGIESLVLDLRSNPGGYFRSATAIANEFLDKGRIVYTRGRQVAKQDVYADRNGAYLDGEVVVLVDPNSASAAEILSGAMKDHARSVIVGQRSYGKGSVQNVIPVRVSDDDREAYLKLTTAYYYLPSSRKLHRVPGSKDWGVAPDIAVHLTPRQMRRYALLQRKAELIRESSPALRQADLRTQYEADLPLATAALLLELKQLQKDQAVHVAAQKTKKDTPS